MTSRLHASQNRSVALISLALLGATGCSSPADSRVDFDPPHAVILISVDTLRADYLGFYGHTNFETSPFLDSFAAESFVFENSIVVEPFTLTSHMSLLTGLYPQHHKVSRKSALPVEIDSLAAMMKRGGYLTRAHVDGGWMRDRWGFARGFDTYEDGKRRGFGNILAEARAWLDTLDGQQFFLFLHTYDVHNWKRVPYYRSPAETRGMYSTGLDSNLESDDVDQFERRFPGRKKLLSEADLEYLRATYAEGVRYVDGALEDFFAYLKQKGLYERVLIILWSDHGEGLYDHGDWGHQELYRHTIRAPLVLRVPGLAGEGRRVESVVSAVDLLPTILELAGLPVPAGLDGHSIVDRLFDDPGDGEAYSIESRRRLFSVSTPRHHLILDGDKARYRFFDLASDPGETIDLWPSKIPEARRLHGRLSEWIEKYESAKASRTAGEAASVDAKTEEELRALGYVE